MTTVNGCRRESTWPTTTRSGSYSKQGRNVKLKKRPHFINFEISVFFPLCYLKTSKCDPFQIAMKNWLDEFNKMLKSKGVYAKAFTFKQMGSGGRFGGEHTLSILCFALDSIWRSTD